MKVAAATPPGTAVTLVDDRLCDAFAALDEAAGGAVAAGMSAMTGGQLVRAVELTRCVKGRLPVVWGGPHPTLLPDQCITEGGADFVAIGDGEPFVGPFLEYLTGRLDAQCVPGLAYVSRGSVVRNAPGHATDLDSGLLIFSRRTDLGPYVTARDCFQRALAVETSRGCPHACGFCHNAVARRQWRAASAGAVVEAALRIAQAYQLDGLVFQEDNFFVSRRRSDDICAGLQDAPFRWKANCRISYVATWGEAFLSQLERGGCAVLQFGVESGSDTVLRDIGKAITREQILGANQLLARSGIIVRYNFMLGLPGESGDDVAATLSLAEQLRKANPNVMTPFFNVYTPYPGTPLFARLQRDGYPTPQSLQEWAEMTWNREPGPWLEPTTRAMVARVSRESFDQSSYFGVSA